MSIELHGKIDDDGKLLMYRRCDMLDWINTHRGKEVTLKFSVRRKRRSNRQNDYYWVCVVAMVKDALNDLGNEFSADETHEVLKAKFNFIEVVNKKGVSDDVVKSTTRLNTVEFDEYIEKIKRWAAEFLEIYIPEPSAQSNIDFR